MCLLYIIFACSKTKITVKLWWRIFIFKTRILSMVRSKLQPSELLTALITETPISLDYKTFWNTIKMLNPFTKKE